MPDPHDSVLPPRGSACFLSLGAWLACAAVSVCFAYQGACAAGSGPGGWGIHMFFVLPIVAVVGFFCAGAGSLLAAALPLPLWGRVLFLLAVAVFGTYFVSYGVFRHLNSPGPPPSAGSLTRRSSERLLAAVPVPRAASVLASSRRSACNR